MSGLGLALVLSTLAAVPDAGAPADAASLSPVDAVPAAAPPPRPQPVAVGPPVFERRNTWDLGLEGGVGTRLPSWNLLGLARLRLGALWIRNSFYWSLGVTAEWSSTHVLTFGVQGELMHLETGLWVQAAPLLDVTPRPGLMLSVGYSLLGVEAQLRDFQGVVGFAVFAKLRLPVRLLLKALGV